MKKIIPCDRERQYGDERFTMIRVMALVTFERLQLAGNLLAGQKMFMQKGSLW
jgi:hypothetical protein